MPSKLKSETARANGAKSRGPATSAGRVRSSQNAIRHGLCAKSVLLPGESEEEYQAFLDSYVERFQPADGVELDLVHSMALARWRLRRLATVEAHLYQNHMHTYRDDIDEYCPTGGPDESLAWVFRDLADGQNVLTLLIRYEGSLTRCFDRAFKQLQTLQSKRPPVSPNEPNKTQPAPRHRAASASDRPSDRNSQCDPSKESSPHFTGKHPILMEFPPRRENHEKERQ